MNMPDNLFYGWFDDATQPANKPSFDPPHDGPCLFCGTAITVNDVRTHSIMYQAQSYAKRAYFYRTHRTCAEADKTGTGVDNIIFDMIAKNGD